MGVALILYALGINEQTMMEDYLASNVYLSDKREFLQAELDQIKTTLGSVEKFLKTVLEVDISAFRKQFLY